MVITVPPAVDGLTPQWLSEVMGGVVTEVRVEQIALDSGFSSSLFRAHLSGDGVPDSVIVKLPAEGAAGDAMKMLGGYAREVAFYRDVAGCAPLGTPQVYAARMDDNQADFVLVLEDLVRWDNADHLAGLSIERARRCIAELAGLHAWSLDAVNAARAGGVSEHRYTDDARPSACRFRSGMEGVPGQGQRADSPLGHRVRGAVRRTGACSSRCAERARDAHPRRHPRRQPVLLRRAT